MLLKGSCSCGAVHFQVRSTTPYPYQYCYCSICRKAQGGYAINLAADAASHMMLAFKAPWVEAPRKPKDKSFQRNPKESIADWHACHGKGASL